MRSVESQSIPTRALEDAPWSVGRIQSYAEHDPHGLALTLWAHARAAAMFGVDPVVTMLAATGPDSPVLDGLTVVSAGDVPESLPLVEDYAEGMTMALVGLCLGVLGDDDNYSQIIVETAEHTDAAWDQIRAVAVDGRRFSFTVQREDGFS